MAHLATALLNQWKARQLAPFLDSARANGLVLFLGAGVSVPPPSSCPTWSQLMGEFLSALSERSPEARPAPAGPLRAEAPSPSGLRLRPEAFFRSLTLVLGDDPVRRMLQGLSFGKFNPIHWAAARLVGVGAVHSIITTNFDHHVEQALTALGTGYHPIRDEEEAAAWLANRPGVTAIFKPHGCLTKPGSMKFTLSEIQNLPASKRDVFEVLMRDRAALFLGYSGNDDDILPLVQDKARASGAHFCVVVYPGSNPSEPIQRWDLGRNPRVHRIVSSSLDVLQWVSDFLRLNDDSRDRGPGAAVPGPMEDWRSPIRAEIGKLSASTMAIVLAQLYADGGNPRQSLALTEIAEQLIGPGLERMQIGFILEQRARVLKELGRFEEAVRAQDQGSWVPRPSLSTLHAIHIRLRQGDLAGAENLLRELSPRLEEKTWGRAETMTFLWYLGILLRKQGNPAGAEPPLRRALHLARDADDVWHVGRILLDLAAVLCMNAQDGMSLEARFNEALRLWHEAAEVAARATDWSTAAKAAKNQGALLRLSDSPELGMREIRRAQEFFAKAGDLDGAERALRMLSFTKEQVMQEFFFGPVDDEAQDRAK